MSWFRSKSLLDKTYRWGLFAKGLDGLLELLGGVLLITASPQAITGVTRFLTQREIVHNPHDFIATHIMAKVVGVSLGAGHIYHLFAVPNICCDCTAVTRHDLFDGGGCGGYFACVARVAFAQDCRLKVSLGLLTKHVVV